MRRDRGRVGRGVFPPAQVAEVKALACELPAEQGVPLSRWSSAELAHGGGQARDRRDDRGGHDLAVAVVRTRSARGTTARGSSRATRSSREKAGRILDLYEGRWEGQLLEPGEFVVCADEKPSIQARARKHPSRARQARR